MIEKIYIFDLDGTLIKTPTPEVGKDIWIKNTGKPWEHTGWWSKPDSLNCDVFDPKVDDWVYGEFKKYCKDHNSLVYVVTGRLLRLMNEVKGVLEHNDIKIRTKPGELGLDGIFCNPGGDTLGYKLNFFDNLIEKNESLKEMVIFEDREDHLVKFIKWAKTKSVKISIIDASNKNKIF